MFRTSNDNGITWDPSLDESPLVIESQRSGSSEVISFDNHVYVTYITFDNGNQKIHFRSSNDNGLTWNPPLSQPSLVLSNLEDSSIAFGSGSPLSIAAFQDSVYVVWNEKHETSDNAVIRFRTSNDNGITWDPSLSSNPKTLSDTAHGSFDPTVSASGDHVFVAWNQVTSPKGIFLSRSLDDGFSFETPIKLSEAASPSSSTRLVTIDSSGNDVYAIWQQVFIGSDYDLMVRKSHDLGTTWEPPLPSSPTKIVDSTEHNCHLCHIDSAVARDSLFVVQDSRELLELPRGLLGAMLFRDSYDKDQSWYPPLSQDPANTIGGNTMLFYPSLSSSNNHVYLVMESDPIPNRYSPDNDHRSEISLHIGSNIKPDFATNESWHSERQHSASWASVNNTPLLPLTLSWKISLDDRVRSTPVVDPSLGYLYVGDDDGMLYALDITDGSTVWSSNLSGDFLSTPYLATKKAEPNHVLYITTSNARLYSINALSGNTLWQVSLPSSSYDMSSPLTFGGTVYFVYEDPTTNTNVLRAVRDSDGTTLWETPLNGEGITSPMEVLGRLYVGMSQPGNTFSSIDAGDGSLLWSKTDANIESSFHTSGVASVIPELDPNKYEIYTSISQGKITALDSATGSEIWETVLPASHEDVTGFALTQHRIPNTLVVSQLSWLHALDAESSYIRWTKSFGDNFWTGTTTQPAIWGNYVFHVTDGNELTAFSLSDGATLWSYTLDSGTVSSPAIAGGSLYIGDNSGNIYKFDAPQVIPEFNSIVMIILTSTIGIVILLNQIILRNTMFH